VTARATPVNGSRPPPRGSLGGRECSAVAAEAAVSAPGECHACVHIGLPKTATTTVQQFLFPHHPDIHYLGRLIGGRHVFRSREVESMVLAIRSGKATGAERARFRGQLDEMGRSPRARGKIVVLSDESLVMGSLEQRRRRAELLSSVFKPCRVIITLRRPEALIESFYFQKVVNEQLDGRRSFGTPLTYLDIDEWLEVNWTRSAGGALAALDYARTIEVFTAVFGKEALGVFLMEQLTQDPDTYYRTLCRFIGVDEQQGLALVRDRRANTRLGQQAIDRIMQISESRAWSFLFRYSPGVLRRRMVGVSSDPISGQRPRASTQIPESWRERVVELTRDGNRRLLAEFGVPLDRFGYPL
jgi:hypothetical protein